MDEQTFVQELMAMERTLYRVSRSLLPGWHDCADAVQEAAKKAWEKRERAEPAWFRPWLTRILINECHNLQRQRKRLIPLAQMPEKPFEAPPDPVLRDALAALPEKLRLPLILNCLEGFTVCQTARMMSIPQGTVKWRLSKAREQLRMRLAEMEARE